MGVEANKNLQHRVKNFNKKPSGMKKSTIISTVFFMIIVSFCLSNAFILYDGTGRPVRVERQVVPMKTDLDDFLSLYGTNLPNNQANHNIRPSKPEPNEYADWYMNNMGALAL